MYCIGAGRENHREGAADLGGKGSVGRLRRAPTRFLEGLVIVNNM